MGGETGKKEEIGEGERNWEKTQFLFNPTEGTLSRRGPFCVMLATGCLPSNHFLDTPIPPSDRRLPPAFVFLLPYR
jgi:hypothetical protein